MKPFTSVYTEQEIVIPNQSEADSLFQDGYGYRKNQRHYLRGVEALFNLERGKIIVIDEESNKTLTIQELLNKLLNKDPELWINFIVYKDLRTRGFIIEIKDKTFKIYERGDYRKKPPSYQLKILSEGKPEKIKKFLKQLETAKNEPITIKLAVVDRRGEIVYYGVEEKELSRVSTS
jgi:tRNA-intron endonuclease, archaea type